MVNLVFYRDSSLCNAFIMNNVNYMIKTITASPELLDMIRKEYPLKLSKDVLQAAENYFSSILQQVMYSLRAYGFFVKNRFKTFKDILFKFVPVKSACLRSGC